MRAILVKEFGDAEVMQVGEVEVPEPGRDEILVRILAAGVRPCDVKQRRGGWSGPLPYIPGREFAGLVVGDTGADAGFGDGTPVYGWPGPGGCYAQYVTCDVERLAPIPAGLRVTDAAAVVVDQTAPDWPDQVRKVTDGGAEKVLACSASSLPGAARAARDDAITATPVKAELPEADRVRWETYECQPSGSRLIRVAPRFDDGALSVHVSAMYWQDAAQAHRAVEQYDIPGEVVLIVDDDLAATLEV